MPTFTHIVGFALIALSLGYAVSALPTFAIADVRIPPIIGTDAISCSLAKCFYELEIKIRALALCGTMDDLKIASDVAVALLKNCATELLKIGTGVVVNADAKANIAACVAAIITLLVKVCAQVSVKFGTGAVIPLWAQIDIALQLLLVTLSTRIGGGILALIARGLASVSVELLVEAQLKFCLGILGFTGLGV